VGFAAIVEVAKEALAEEAGLKIRPATEPSPRPERTRATVGTAAKSKRKAEPAAEKPAKAAKPAKTQPAKKAAPAKPAKAAPAEKPAKPVKAAAAEKPAKAPKAAKAEKAAAEAPAKKDLEALTVSELEKLAEKRGIARGDVEGSGASGNVVKADWIRALAGK
jgi:hypothetical protein